MKPSVKDIFLYLLAGASVYAMLYAHQCTNKPVDAAPIVLTDTEYVKTVVDHIVIIRDTAIEYKYLPNPDTSVLVIQAEPDTIGANNEYMNLFEGTLQGKQCTYHYQAGISQDSLRYISIDSECTSTVPVEAVVVTSDFPLPDPIQLPGHTGNYPWVGFKTGWSPWEPIKGSSFGIHGGVGVFYGGVNMLTGVNAIQLEAGIQLVIKPKARLFAEKPPK